MKPESLVGLLANLNVIVRNGFLLKEEFFEIDVVAEVLGAQKVLTDQREDGSSGRTWSMSGFPFLAQLKDSMGEPIEPECTLSRTYRNGQWIGTKLYLFPGERTVDYEMLVKLFGEPHYHGLDHRCAVTSFVMSYRWHLEITTVQIFVTLTNSNCLDYVDFVHSVGIDSRAF